MAEVPEPTEQELNHAIDQVVNGMGFHPGNADVAPLYETLREAYIDVGRLVAQICPTGYAKSWALNSLENSLMWATKSVALSQPLGEERRG